MKFVTEFPYEELSNKRGVPKTGDSATHSYLWPFNIYCEISGESPYSVSSWIKAEKMWSWRKSAQRKPDFAEGRRINEMLLDLH